MKPKTGFEELLDALKQSGVNMDGVGSPFGGSGDGTGGPTGAAQASAGDDGRTPFTTSVEDPQGREPGAGGAGGAGGGKAPGLDLSFFDKLKDFGGKMLTLFAILAILAIAVAYWWFHPPINIHSMDTWTFIFVIMVLLCLFFVWKSRSHSAGSVKSGKKSEGKAKAFKFAAMVPLAVIALGFLGTILSFAFFPGNAAKYSSVLETDTLEFAEDIQEVNYSEIPVIDRDSAILLGNREMGAIPEYVSQFEISPLYSQINYQGEPVRVSPLGYADLFKWFTNREEGIPAYALVNMTTQDADIVRLGDAPIHYSPSEPLFRNIYRHVQLSYPFYMFDSFSFEIDEEGHAWWICPVQTRTIGLFGGTTIERVVLCDATTGECQDLAVEDCPQWVDGVYPADLLVQQYNWYGMYNNGWLNSFLGQSNVVQTTPGTDGKLGYNYIAKDDDVWVYTGVTSATADDSIIGIVLMNQRTQESHFYSVSGATEDSAMQSAEGQVQNLRYTATFPLLINVSNQPTYFMALKDDAGLVKKFAMVDIQRYQNVATGDTVAQCQKAYEALLATNGVVSGETSAEDLDKAEGVIRSMAQAVVDGNSHFYVTLNGVDGIFDFALPGLIEVVAFAEGDFIEFSYLPGSPLNAVYQIEGSELTVLDAVEGVGEAPAEENVVEEVVEAAPEPEAEVTA